MSTTNFSKIYETVLSTPGMNDPVKIELKISRRNVFLLARALERGLMEKPDSGVVNVLTLATPEAMEELAAVPSELLRRAGLTEVNENLKALKP